MTTKQDAAKERAGGFRCPKCNCGHSVVVYLKRMMNKIGRRRQCRHCGHRFMTYESTGAGDPHEK